MRLIRLTFFVVLAAGCGKDRQQPAHDPDAAATDVSTPDMGVDDSGTVFGDTGRPTWELGPPVGGERARTQSVQGRANAVGDVAAVWCAHTGTGTQLAAALFNSAIGSWGAETTLIEDVGSDRECAEQPNAPMVRSDGDGFVVNALGRTFQFADGVWTERERLIELVETNSGYAGRRPNASDDAVEVYEAGVWLTETAPCTIRELVGGGDPFVICRDDRVAWRRNGTWSATSLTANGVRQLRAASLADSWVITWGEADVEPSVHRFAAHLSANGLDTIDLGAHRPLQSTFSCAVQTSGESVCNDAAPLVAGTTGIALLQTADGAFYARVDAATGWLDTTPVVLDTPGIDGAIRAIQGAGEALLWWSTSNGYELHAVVLNSTTLQVLSTAATDADDFRTAGQVAAGEWLLSDDAVDVPSWRLAAGVWHDLGQRPGGALVTGGGSAFAVAARDYDVLAQRPMDAGWTAPESIISSPLMRSKHLRDLSVNGTYSLVAQSQLEPVFALGNERARSDLTLQVSGDGATWTDPAKLGWIDGAFDPLGPAYGNVAAHRTTPLGTVFGGGDEDEMRFGLLRATGELVAAPLVSVALADSSPGTPARPPAPLVAASESMALAAWVDETPTGSVALFEDGRWHPPETLHGQASRFLDAAVNGERAVVVWREVATPADGGFVDGQGYPSEWKAATRSPSGWTTDTIASGDWAFAQGAQVAPLGAQGFVALLSVDGQSGYLAIHDGTTWGEPLLVPNIPDFAREGGMSPIVGFENGSACGLVQGESGRTTMWVFDGNTVETRPLPSGTPEDVRTRFAGTANGCVLAFRASGAVTLWGWRSGAWLEPEGLPFGGDPYSLLAVGGDDDRFLALWSPGTDGTSLWYSLHDGTGWTGPATFQTELAGPSEPHVAATADGFFVAWTERDATHPATRVIRYQNWVPAP